MLFSYFACIMEEAVDSNTEAAYENAVKVANDIDGFGEYCSTHIVRTVYLIAQEEPIVHPSTSFVVMSKESGATEGKYKFFKHRGINDIASINRFIQQNFPGEAYLHAGEFAYLICETSKLIIRQEIPILKID